METRKAYREEVVCPRCIGLGYKPTGGCCCGGDAIPCKLCEEQGLVDVSKVIESDREFITAAVDFLCSLRHSSEEERNHALEDLDELPWFRERVDGDLADYNPDGGSAWWIELPQTDDLFPLEDENEGKYYSFPPLSDRD